MKVTLLLACFTVGGIHAKESRTVAETAALVEKLRAEYVWLVLPNRATAPTSISSNEDTAWDATAAPRKGVRVHTISVPLVDSKLLLV